MGGEGAFFLNQWEHRMRSFDGEKVANILFYNSDLNAFDSIFIDRRRPIICTPFKKKS